MKADVLRTATVFVLEHAPSLLISAHPHFPVPAPVNEQNKNNYQLLQWPLLHR